MKITPICLFIASAGMFYFDSYNRLNTNTYYNRSIEPHFSNNTHLTLYDLIDNCVTNYFIVFQNCFISAFGTTCFIILGCVLAYFQTIDCLFKYLTLCADHLLVFPNSIIFTFLFVLVFSIYYPPKSVKILKDENPEITRSI